MLQPLSKPIFLYRKSPIFIGLCLVVIFSLARAVVGWSANLLFEGQLFQLSLPFGMYSLAVFALLSIGLCGPGLIAVTRTSWTALGWQKEGFFTVLWRSIFGFALTYIVTFAWVVLAIQLTPPPPGVAAGAAPSLDPGALLAKAIWGFFIAAWQEENLFRGYLQPHLIQKLGYWPGILAQAVLFSAAHLGFHQIWWQFVASFLMGLILGGLRGKNRSLVPAFIAHGLSWPLIS